MPKITTHGGASNAREVLDPAVPTPAPAPAVDGPAAELTREEDPNAPAPRPGEHVAFFAEPAGEQPAGGEGGETPEGSDGSAEASGDDGEDSAAPTPPDSSHGASGSRS